MLGEEEEEEEEEEEGEEEPAWLYERVKYETILLTHAAMGKPFMSARGPGLTVQALPQRYAQRTGGELPLRQLCGEEGSVEGLLGMMEDDLYTDVSPPYSRTLGCNPS